jgi:hypothetical protein
MQCIGVDMGNEDRLRKYGLVTPLWVWGVCVAGEPAIPYREQFVREYTLLYLYFEYT